MQIKYNNKEVENPMMRFIVGIFTPILFMFFILLWVAVLVVLVPLLLVTHVILRVLGRRGNFRNEAHKVNLTLNRDSFRKAA